MVPSIDDVGKRARSYDQTAIVVEINDDATAVIIVECSVRDERRLKALPPEAKQVNTSRKIT